jgi:hypothetical protein
MWIRALTFIEVETIYFSSPHSRRELRRVRRTRWVNVNNIRAADDRQVRALTFLDHTGLWLVAATSRGDRRFSTRSTTKQ